MKSYDLSVIAPCYNESQNVVALHDRLKKTFEKKNILGQIVFVNDASTDNTGELIDALARQDADVKTVHHAKNRGIAGGWKSGLDAADGRYACFIDADLQNLPEDVGRLYQEIQFSNVDVVSGWRNHVNLKKDLRYYISKSLHHLLNFLFGMSLRDNKSGFVLARKDVMKDMLAHRYAYHHPQTFITIAAHAKGYSIKQIETLFDERRFGKSYLLGTSLVIASWKTFADVLKGFFEFRLFVGSHDNFLRDFLKQNADSMPERKEERLPFWRKALFRLYHLTFPLHHWMISYPAVDYYRDLSKSQWLPPSLMKEYQNKRLRQLMIHAYQNVAFYRDRFRELGLMPDDIQTVEDLQKLPIIDKKIVRENLYLGLMSNTHDKKSIQKATTSGSTGEPFFTYLEKRQLEFRWGATLRSVEWTGYRFGDKQLRLWHKYLGMKWKESLREIIDAKLTRRSFIPAYEMDEKGLEKFMQRIREYKPYFMDGYAESFNFIARYLKRGAYDGFKPKAIMSSAQMLPEQSRKIIEEGFGCRVFDKYGAREFGGGLAYECDAHDGLHVVAECAIIEIIKDGKQVGPGEVGEVVITDLNNFSVPLIRYRVGDLAKQFDNSVPCRCGRGLPKIGEIQGRIQSTIIGTENQCVPGSFFARLFADYDYAISQFQVVQPDFGKLVFNIVKADLYDPRIMEKVVEETKRHLGQNMDVSVAFVDQVALGRTGKRQHTLSQIDVGSILSKIP